MDATLSLGPAAPQPVRHAARRHRAVGRAEAAADAGGGGRARAAPIATGRSRRACSRSARHVDICDDRLLAVEALLEVKQQVAPYLDLQLVAFPQDGYYRSPGALRQPASARSTWASTSSAASRISSAPWPTAPRSVRAAVRDRGRARPDGRHALRRDRRSAVAPHRDAGLPRRSGSACRAASPARTSPRCTRWTTTTSRKLLPLIAEARRAARSPIR